MILLLQVNELELAVDARSMSNLLDFLRHSFGGGTDVDRPLELSLQRLESQGWEQVRLLLCCRLTLVPDMRN